MDAFVGLALFCLLISPLIYFELKMKALAYVTIATAAIALVTWGSLIAGWISGPIWTAVWNVSLFAAATLIITGISLVFVKIKPKNRQLLVILILLIAVVSVALGSFSNITQMNVVVTYLFLFFMPMMVIAITVIGALQHFNNDTAN